MLLQHTLSRAAQASPDAVAVVSGRERLTYRELDELSNRIARQLLAMGCRTGDRVGLLLPKSIEAIAGMLGILKAGATYVPMDTSSPPPRLGKIIDQCEPVCILASNSASRLLNAMVSQREVRCSVPVGWLDRAEPGDPQFEIAFRWLDCLSGTATAPACSTTPDDAAHILFTSGSTGMPKGVIITHRNVTHFLDWAIRYFGTVASDRISCHPPLHFDLSTFDIYGTFLAGAQLHLVSPEVSLLPHKLAEFMRRSELTQWFSVPSALKYMAQFDAVKQDDFPALKRLLWCGEALPTPTLIYWMKKLPHVTFTNLYGPTETTIASSYYTVPACPASELAAVPVGTACEGEHLFVLGQDGAAVPPGEVGDLYISGVGLSPGYWRDPEKTSAVFLDSDRGRIYRTGDLARTGNDGLIYLVGRADSQIKSRGYRIELGEIEAALHALGALQACAVVAIPTNGFEGNEICCAYVEPVPGGTSPTQLRDQLARRVPSYMLPSQWMALPELPLNGNGKIDRPLLRKQFQERPFKAPAASA